MNITHAAQCLAGLICLFESSGAAVQIPGASPENHSQVTAELEPRRVAVPEPSQLAVERHRSGIVYWGIIQLWAIAVPCGFLFTGLSARIRTWATARRTHWVIAIAIYLIIYATIDFIVDFPLAYYLGFVRPHSYGLSNQTLSHWIANELKGFLAGGAAQTPPPLQLPGLVPAFVLLAVLYGVIRISPARWWLYTGFLLIPMTIVTTFLTPLWIAPLFNEFGSMKDKALEADILALAHRAGIDGGRVYEVDKSRDTKTINAYVTGVFGSKRIVLWDTAIAQLDRRELMVVMGHEIGHYALGHVVQGITFMSASMFFGLYAVHVSAVWLMRKLGSRFGFNQLSDIASLPLLLVLLNIASLLFAPVTMAISRSFERAADRFALEITRDNYAAATAEVKFMERSLSVPSPGWFPEIWRATHPSPAERIEFANEYRPWETGQPLRYGHLFRQERSEVNLHP